MNIYNFNDDAFKATTIYQKFTSANPSQGYLKIRASAASQAIPISGLKIVVSKVIDNNQIICYEGLTNSSGVIEKIVLPAPKKNDDDLIAPPSTTYDIKATYEPNNLDDTYQVNIYENIYVVQRINLVPTLNVIGDDN